jgi:arylsulfatase A-like enzyme
MPMSEASSIPGVLARASLLIAALVGPHSISRADDADRPPNVVLIIADDMGWTDFGFMGHPQIRTPRLDLLARQSLAFRRGHVTSSLCSPSLASILTGRYPHEHKITSNDPPLPPGADERGIQRDPAFIKRRQEMIKAFDEMQTLPRLLAPKGYLSFQSGKWWGGSYKRGGFTQGMTHGDPERGGRHGDVGLAIGRQGMKPLMIFAELAQVRKAPFFLWYAPMMPHQPHNPPERLLAHYRDKTPSQQVARYWAMCEWFDETCGELLDFLDAQKLADNTIVIFLADNGWIQDPQEDTYDPRSKQSPYEGGLRTPILIRWPGKVAPRTCDTPVNSIDIAPTILKAAGLEPPPGMEGINLRDDKAVSGRQAIFGEIFTHNAVNIHTPASSLLYRWVIAGDWKLVLPNPVLVPQGVVELFDVVHDPGETRNVARDQPQKVAELSDRVHKWWLAVRQ